VLGEAINRSTFISESDALPDVRVGLGKTTLLKGVGFEFSIVPFCHALPAQGSRKRGPKGLENGSQNMEIALPRRFFGHGATEQRSSSP